MADFIPDSDAEFELWRSAFDTYLKNNLSALGLTAAQTAALNALQIAWESALKSVGNARSALEAATALKNDTRQQLVDAIRELVRQIQSNPATTDDQRAGLGVTVPDTKPTRVPIPTTNPIGQVNTSLPIQHSIGFRDSQTPNSKAKPEGCKGCQIWYFIGPQPPASIDDYIYAATDSRTPYVLHFDIEDVGKTVHYRLRWVNTRDEPGPWSEPISATITG